MAGSVIRKMYGRSLRQALQMICRIRCSHRAVAARQTITANSARLLRANDKHRPLQTKSRYCPTIIYSYIHPMLLHTNLPGVYLKSRNYRLFLQTQRDFALKSLGIRKGFLRLFALHPACVCETPVIFFVFRYTLTKLLFLLYIFQLPKVWYNVWYEG